ncbi:uncharacterized protein [Mytilus edulis]|uniref:uncharacterized protein n=1 Tax=Mytilus edulis TaxID=6550 RepID=UPI0039EF074B
MIMLIDRKDRHKTQDFFEWTVPRYFPDMFKKFFRISPQSFELVCQLLGANEQLAKRTYRGGRQEIPLEKKVMIVLRYLASQETILGISDRFNITVSTFTKYREKVVNAINDLLPRFVQWPEELDSVAIKFNEMGTYEFQNIIGAIDGSHIPIEQPLECPNSYYNRKISLSCCVLHNICLQSDEDIAEFIDAEIDELDANLGENFPVNADNGEGILKRNNLTIELNRVNS